MPVITTYSSLSDQAFGGFNSGFPPVNSNLPVITGTYQARRTLTCSTGTWIGTPQEITFAYQWKRNSVKISGATSSTYIVPSYYTGSIITCEITATNTRGISFATAAGSTIQPNVPIVTGVQVTVNNYNLITVTGTGVDNGGASTTYSLVCNVPTFNRTQVDNASFVLNIDPSLMTTSFTFTLQATNSVGTSDITPVSAPVKTQPALGALVSYIAGTSAYGKYVGNQRVVNYINTTNSTWAGSNSFLNGLAHPYTSTWALPTLSEAQQYRIWSGIWNAATSWTSTSSQLGQHDVMLSTGASESKPDSSTYFAMGLALIER